MDHFLSTFLGFVMYDVITSNLRVRVFWPSRTYPRNVGPTYVVMCTSDGFFFEICFNWKNMVGGCDGLFVCRVLDAPAVAHIRSITSLACTSHAS